jgi:5-methylthioribose kinase
VKLNGINQVLVYTDIYCGKHNAIKKNKEVLSEVNKEVGLEVNVDKTKNLFIPRYQNAGKN